MDYEVKGRFVGAVSVSQIAVLIPTRNRPEKISKLLESLLFSTIKPSQIVIIASGVDIKTHLQRFETQFKITYQHTQSSGQIAQKKIGIKLISKEIDWCLFLDDDLIVHSEAIESAIEAVKSNSSIGVVGVGFSLPATSRVEDVNTVTRLMGKLVGISNNNPGKVLKNGHATSYMQEDEIIVTEWLNGASMWKKSVLGTYGEGLPSTTYAACEDLLFSYPIGKKSKLIYVPEAKLDFQKDELSNYNSLEIIRASTFWRYYFVSIHKELSIYLFLVAQVGRAIFSLRETCSSRGPFILQLLKIHVKVICSMIKRTDPRELLEKI
jgi:glycosyltransferase involved in cell wall biosynthesis